MENYVMITSENEHQVKQDLSQYKLDNILDSFFKATKQNFKVELNYEIKENENSIKVISLEWLDGEWLDGKWYNGVWHDGIWYYGIWHNGIWKHGIS